MWRENIDHSLVSTNKYDVRQCVCSVQLLEGKEENPFTTSR